MYCKSDLHMLPLHQANFKRHEYIFSGTICKPAATKLVIEQSGPFSHVASECTQIFLLHKVILNFLTIHFYNSVMEAFGPRLVELLKLQ